MSAKGRGAPSYAFDEYSTPAWCVHRLLDRVKLAVGKLWLEPCAGDGSLIHAINSHWSTGKINWHTNEIQEKYLNQLQCIGSVKATFTEDIRTWEEKDGIFYDMMITNPPFSIAQEVAEAGFRVAKTVVLLLRINFFGSKERHEWLSTHMPKLTAVLPDRPAFRVSQTTGKLGTDATEYCWMIWERGSEGHPFFNTKGEIILLDKTDPSVLRADRERIREQAK